MAGDVRQTGGDPLARLTPEHDFRVRRLPLAWYVERIRRRSFFSYARINHRFWELELELHRNPPGRSPEARAEADRALGRVAYLESGFREELLADLGSLAPDDPALWFATSHEGYPGSCRLEGDTPDPGAVFALMRRLLPRGLVPHDGMLFQRAAVSGEIRSFFAALRDLPVLVVGPDWLDALGERFALPETTLLPIPGREARAERWEILERVAEARARLDANRPAAILFEAGTLAPWLIRRLHGRLASTFLIDVGRPLDVCRPDVVFRHDWGRVFRRELADHLGIVDPRVRDSRDVFDPARRASAGPAVGATRTTAVHALERDLAEHLELPDEARLVATASGAAALRVLLSLEGADAVRPLRWLAPALMDSRAATVSAVARARRVDTDARGLLDARALDALDPDTWQGVVVSDLFGLAESFEPIARRVRGLGKSLVVEGFAALDAMRRRRTGRLPEALCLGDGRPWGAASLGMACVYADDETLARRLVSGEGASVAPCPPSEAAVAAVRARLVDLSAEGTRRHLQYRRLARFAAAVGWTVLGPAVTLERCATPGVVPLLAPTPLDRSRFRAGILGLRPAGPAPDARSAVARSLHARLVLAPCDPGLEVFSNDQLRSALRAALPARPSGPATAAGTHHPAPGARP